MTNEQKNLLALSRKALQLCHDKLGMDFCKPYFIIEGYGNFTYNSLMKLIKVRTDKKCAKALFLVNQNKYRADYQKLYYIKFGNSFESVDVVIGADHYKYREIDDFYRKSDFEDARKESRAHWFVVIQNEEYLASGKTYIVDFMYDRFKCKYGEQFVLLSDNRKEINYRVSWFGRNKPKADEILDKSGYIRWDNVMTYKEKARALKAQRDKEKADAFDCTTESYKIGEEVTAIRKKISDLVLNGKTARNIADILNKLSWLESDYVNHCLKVKDKKFGSVKAIQDSIDGMNEYVNKINDMINELY